MSNEEAINELKYAQAMFNFDPATGEVGFRNEEDKRQYETCGMGITALKKNSKLKAMVDTLADCLDGCPLRDPCNDLPREWCMEHCGYKQQEPSKECWIKWAEVMASE